MKAASHIENELRRRKFLVDKIFEINETIRLNGAVATGARVMSDIAELGWALDANSYFLSGVFDCAAEDIPTVDEFNMIVDEEMYRAALTGIRRDLISKGGAASRSAGVEPPSYWKKLGEIEREGSLVRFEDGSAV